MIVMLPRLFHWAGVLFSAAQEVTDRRGALMAFALLRRLRVFVYLGGNRLLSTSRHI